MAILFYFKYLSSQYTFLPYLNGKESAGIKLKIDLSLRKIYWLHWCVALKIARSYIVMVCFQLLNLSPTTIIRKILILFLGSSSVCSTHATNLHSKFCGYYLAFDTATASIGNYAVCGKKAWIYKITIHPKLRKFEIKLPFGQLANSQFIQHYYPKCSF